MTDNEITRARQIIKDLHTYCFCSQSIFKAQGYNFTQSDFICLYNLIDNLNRQKAEIKKYQKGIKKMMEKHRLYEANMDATREYQIVQAKVEAIKEFAERLIDIAVGNWKQNVSIATIDNLVKEMTEQKNDLRSDQHLCRWQKE